MTTGKLDESKYFVDANIGRAESLPASAFTGEEFLQLELRTIFSKTWLLIPDQGEKGSASLSDLLRTPGTRVPFSLLDKPMFLQHGSNKKLSCFPNVCTHAWHLLVESPTVGGAVVCPQHGRQFDNEGRFLSQAGFEKLENFPRESDHLRDLGVVVLGPFFLVCLGRALAPFHQFV